MYYLKTATWKRENRGSVNVLSITGYQVVGEADIKRVAIEKAKTLAKQRDELVHVIKEQEGKKRRRIVSVFPDGDMIYDPIPDVAMPGERIN